MVKWFEPTHVVYVHAGMVDVKYLKLVIFVAGRKNEFFAVLPLQSVGFVYVWAYSGNGMGRAPVLHDNSVDLVVGVCYSARAVVETQDHLLVLCIKINVGVGRNLHGNRHYVFNDLETDFYGGTFISVVLVKDQQFVVPAKQHIGILVGKGHGIVGVVLGGVETVFVVFDGQVVGSVKKIAFKQSFGGFPVAGAMLYAIDIAVIFVRHLVPRNPEVGRLSQGEHGREERVVVEANLKRAYILVKDPMPAMCYSGQHNGSYDE
jgi:hypothetical protein